MDLNQVTLHLTENRFRFGSNTKALNSAGIYAFYFVGRNFPLEGYDSVNDRPVYVGKTRSSGVSRVINTHFAEGKTGSSTLRRTLSALLMDDLSIKPVPRNNSDLKHGRSTFTLNSESEKRLTEWMRENLEISFFSVKDLNMLSEIEEGLIKKLVPVFNLKGNPFNSYKAKIERMRSVCVDYANSDATKPSKEEETLEGINLFGAAIQLTLVLFVCIFLLILALNLFSSVTEW